MSFLYISNFQDDIRTLLQMTSGLNLKEHFNCDVCGNSTMKEWYRHNMRDLDICTACMPNMCGESYVHKTYVCTGCNGTTTGRFYRWRDYSFCERCAATFSDLFLKIDLGQISSYFRSYPSDKIFYFKKENGMIGKISHPIMMIMQKEKPWNVVNMTHLVYQGYKNMVCCNSHKLFKIDLSSWFPVSKIYNHSEAHIILLCSCSSDGSSHAAVLHYFEEGEFCRMVYISDDIEQVVRDISRLEMFNYLKLIVK